MEEGTWHTWENRVADEGVIESDEDVALVTSPLMSVATHVGRCSSNLHERGDVQVLLDFSPQG